MSSHSSSRSSFINIIVPISARRHSHAFTNIHIFHYFYVSVVHIAQSDFFFFQLLSFIDVEHALLNAFYILDFMCLIVSHFEFDNHGQNSCLLLEWYSQIQCQMNMINLKSILNRQILICENMSVFYACCCEIREQLYGSIL